MLQSPMSSQKLKTAECVPIVGYKFEGKPTNDIIHRPCDRKYKDGQLKESFANVAAKEIKNVNEKYFDSYGSFGTQGDGSFGTQGDAQ